VTPRLPAKPAPTRRSRRRHARRSVGRRIGRSLGALIAIAVVAAVTAELLHTVYPNPGSPTAQTGSFSKHHVVITLPAQPTSYLGVYANGVPRSYKNVQSFADYTGVQPNAALYYSGWGEPFQESFATLAADNHAVPLIQIEPDKVSLRLIADGVYNPYLAKFAYDVASYGARTGHGVIISFGHEPNGYWYPWGYKHVAPSIWIAAWRDIVTVFRDQGAYDVTWLWTVNIIDVKGGIRSPGPWWPGAKYVTWVGIDGYYYKSNWQFASLFGPTITAVRSFTTDPILISETGAAPASGQASKIQNLFAGTRSYGLLGFVWFDAKRVKNWKIDTPDARNAFSTGAKTYSGFS
jgi:mannan endo-1,4-beta-mannosidase